jgi:hypothetical protein
VIVTILPAVVRMPRAKIRSRKRHPERTLLKLGSRGIYRLSELASTNHGISAEPLLILGWPLNRRVFQLDDGQQSAHFTTHDLANAYTQDAISAEHLCQMEFIGPTHSAPSFLALFPNVLTGLTDILSAGIWSSM